MIIGCSITWQWIFFHVKDGIARAFYKCSEQYMKFSKKEDKEDNIITCKRASKWASISSPEKVDGVEITDCSQSK